MESGKRQQHDIRNFLGVLGASILCAALLVLVFLYNYSPSGRYLAGNMLLDPAMIQQINDQEKISRTSPKPYFTFDQIEFSFFNTQKGKIFRKQISMNNYEKFYEKVRYEKSVEEVTEDIKDFFNKSIPTNLTINMQKMDSSKSSTPKVFQVVQFVEEDYFRVQLHDQQELGEWVYFYQGQLFQNVMHLFTDPKSL